MFERKDIVQVTLPDCEIRLSIRSLRGWKYYFKLVSRIATPVVNGYDWEGDFLRPGTHDLPVGSVILKVDDSSGHCIYVVEPSGDLRMLQSTSERWSVALADVARAALRA